MKVIAILSCAFSGSTLLDIILSNHANITSGGELARALRSELNSTGKRLCTCGKGFRECRHWSAIREIWHQKFGREAVGRYIQLQNKFEYAWHPKISSIISGESSQRGAMFDEYLDMSVAMFQAIGRVSGTNTVTDSSKDHLRAIALRDHPDIDLRIIHLIRDSRAVVWSATKTKERQKRLEIPQIPLMKTPRQATTNWISKNLQVERVVGRIAENKHTQLRYEELVKDPVLALGRVGKAIDEDFSELSMTIANGKRLDVNHILGGNETRFDADFRLKPDIDWTINMPVLQREVIWLSTGWFARRYGYNRVFGE